MPAAIGLTKAACGYVIAPLTSASNEYQSHAAVSQDNSHRHAQPSRDFSIAKLLLAASVRIAARASGCLRDRQPADTRCRERASPKLLNYETPILCTC